MVETIIPEPCKNEKRYKINILSVVLSVILLILSGVFGINNLSLTAQVKDLEGKDVGTILITRSNALRKNTSF